MAIHTVWRASMNTVFYFCGCWSLVVFREHREGSGPCMVSGRVRRGWGGGDTVYVSEEWIGDWGGYWEGGRGRCATLTSSLMSPLRVSAKWDGNGVCVSWKWKSRVSWTRHNFEFWPRRYSHTHVRSLLWRLFAGLTGQEQGSSGPYLLVLGQAVGVQGKRVFMDWQSITMHHCPFSRGGWYRISL